MAAKQAPGKKAAPKQVEALVHREASRTNIPTAEHQAMLDDRTREPLQLEYERRNPDLDPQLVWRGKAAQDEARLQVQAPPLYIQEKLHPKVLIEDLRRESERRQAQPQSEQTDLFGDFNGLPEGADRTEFYQHEANWTNRMILGDSLQVMASLAEREGLKGKVQCIYLDPPYGIKFNSNFQWSTTSRDVKDGKREHITREPEMVKAFRDTWRDGIHSYLSYLRDRLLLARELLTESGSIFVQIGDENVHRVRALMDEVFGDGNFCSIIQVQKTGSQASALLANTVDFILWYAKSKTNVKYRQLYNDRIAGHVSSDRYDQIELQNGRERRLSREELERTAPLPEGRIFRHTSLISSGLASEEQVFRFQGTEYTPGSSSHWKTTILGMTRLVKASRIAASALTTRYKRLLDDFAVLPITDRWESLQIGTGLVYVVQTSTAVVARCLLMATDPGDLVLDPTCGSGTTAYVAEQWGRRWITIDTSRVALALARARIMGARYPYYLLADTPEGKAKEAAISGRELLPSPAKAKLPAPSLRQGFVYERVPHIKLKAIANNAEIDLIWEQWQPRLQQALAELNATLRGHATPFAVETGGRKGKKIKFSAQPGETFSMPSGEVVPLGELVEWEVPREAPADWPAASHAPFKEFWDCRIARQRQIDDSIARNADYEYLYDKPYSDNKRVRVAGPFTVESISPHRMLAVGEDDELVDNVAEARMQYGSVQDFTSMVLEHLRSAGVQQARKKDRIEFRDLEPWPGEHVCACGRYLEGSEELGKLRRAGIFIGPEFGTVSRPDLVDAAREASEAGFDILIACAFSFDAHSTEFDKLGKVHVLKARMNADLHMAGDLKNTGQGNLFVVFGEPEFELEELAVEGEPMLRVRITGVDVFDPSKGEIRSDDPDGIACWFIDTDYNSESFFVRHAYFLGANDPYKSLKTTLRAEIDEEAWASLHSDVSRPFPKPASGRIAIKVINHLGDEVMKVCRV